MPKVTIRPSAATAAASLHALMKGSESSQHVIGGEHQRNSSRIALGGKRRRNGDRQGRIAAHRLEHDVGLNTAFAELLSDDEAEIGIGDDNRAAKCLAV